MLSGFASMLKLLLNSYLLLIITRNPAYLQAWKG